MTMAGCSKPLLATNSDRPSGDSTSESGRSPTGRWRPAAAIFQPFGSSVTPPPSAPGRADGVTSATADAIVVASSRRSAARIGGSVRRLFERRQDDEPALAVGARAAGERGGEHEIQRRDLPPLLRTAGIERQPVRLEEVFRRVVIPVRVLNAAEERELAARPHVELEDAPRSGDVVVHALA